MDNNLFRNLLRQQINMEVNHLNNGDNINHIRLPFIEILFQNNGDILEQSFQEDEPIKYTPLNKEFIQSLNIRKTTDEDIEAELSCAICQDKFIHGDNIITLPENF